MAAHSVGEDPNPYKERLEHRGQADEILQTGSVESMSRTMLWEIMMELRLMNDRFEQQKGI